MSKMEKTGTAEDVSTFKSTVKTIYICPLIHERQRLQLCALHSINNLLQLDQGLDGGSKISNGIISNTAILCGGRMHTLDKNIPYVTKAEFDSVADELTMKEEEWIQNGTGTAMEGEEGKEISFWKQIWSHHRTPFTGNYSLEVIQETLLRRNVSLQWYNQNEIPMELFGDYCDFEKKRMILLGFILNTVEPFSFTKPSSYIRMGRGRHWFVITRVRRVVGVVQEECRNEDGNKSFCNRTVDVSDEIHGNTNAHINIDTSQIVDSETNQPVVYHRDIWHLINSSSNEVWDLSPEEVMEFIENVRNENGSVLQATLNM